MEYITAHADIVFAMLFLVSELLAEIPQIQSNSIFGLIKGWLKSQAGKVLK